MPKYFHGTERISMKRLLSTLIVIACALSLASPGLAQSGQRVGVFDAQRLSEETDEGKRVQSGLNAFRLRMQGELTAKEKELGDLQSQLNAQALSLSVEKRSALEKDIQRKVLELNQHRETAAREMQLEVGEAQNIFQEKLLGVIQGFGQDEGFDLIIESSLVAFANPSIDVTTALIDRFNQTFKTESEAGSGEGN